MDRKGLDLMRWCTHRQPQHWGSGGKEPGRHDSPNQSRAKPLWPQQKQAETELQCLEALQKNTHCAIAVTQALESQHGLPPEEEAKLKRPG